MVAAIFRIITELRVFVVQGWRGADTAAGLEWSEPIGIMMAWRRSLVTITATGTRLVGGNPSSGSCGCLRQTKWKPFQRATRSDTLLSLHARAPREAGTTHERPVDRFGQEGDALLPTPPGVIPAPKKPQSLPVVLSPQEVVQFLDAVKAASIAPS